MTETVVATERIIMEKIEQLDKDLYTKYGDRVSIDTNLTRQIVSFQANKKIPVYRWYKYKEGFSNNLVNYYLKYNSEYKTNHILDPFAGSGTTLFASSENGISSVGIELLQIGVEIMEVKKVLSERFHLEDYDRLRYYIKETPWKTHSGKVEFTEYRITEGAYSSETKRLINQYLSVIKQENKNVKRVLFFALLCILESVSYTRKDGQYLRWDYRSGRRSGKSQFDKGTILEFDTAITSKLTEILEDTVSTNDEFLFKNFHKKSDTNKIDVIQGSSLIELQKLKNNSIDMVITSPPYANRYDYTRTYALELAMLGITNGELNKLRQTMLSCTVENKEKDLLEINEDWEKVISILKNQELLQSIIEFLYMKKEKKELNNNGIPRMLKGYFYELSCVIYELYRVLDHNGLVVMVNDNVRYSRVSISVDLILSDIAKEIGFTIEKISILPKGKGNSSQQMGAHGRELLRKCVYIWRK